MSIVLTDIRKSYGTTNVLRGVSLIMNAGSTECILGTNGSGKTTLLKILGLIATADVGSINIGGVDLTRQSTGTRELIRNELIGYSFQEPLLIPYLSAVENLLVATDSAPSTSINRKSKALELLSRLGLSSRVNHLPSRLSVGEKKRVDLARALMRRPRILIADEPLSNLDPDSAKLVIEILGGYNDEGRTVVCSASDPAHSRWSPNVMVLREGGG